VIGGKVEANNNKSTASNAGAPGAPGVQTAPVPRPKTGEELAQEQAKRFQEMRERLLAQDARVD
jgi:hypothetical protein